MPRTQNNLIRKGGNIRLCISNARNELGFSQKEFATILGLNPISYNNYETHGNDPNLTALTILSDMLRIPAQEMADAPLSAQARSLRRLKKAGLLNENGYWYVKKLQKKLENVDIMAEPLPSEESVEDYMPVCMASGQALDSEVFSEIEQDALSASFRSYRTAITTRLEEYVRACREDLIPQEEISSLCGIKDLRIARNVYYEDVPKRFGATLRKRRLKLCVSRQTLADHWAISLSSYAKYEAARQEPRLSALRGLCETLDLTLDEAMALKWHPEDDPISRICRHGLNIIPMEKLLALISPDWKMSSWYFWIVEKESLSETLRDVLEFDKNDYSILGPIHKNVLVDFDASAAKAEKETYEGYLAHLTQELSDTIKAVSTKKYRPDGRDNAGEASPFIKRDGVMHIKSVKKSGGSHAKARNVR